VDHWHLVRLAILMVTKVRQRVAQETKGHRGRKDDLAWAHRMLLLRAGDKLSERAVHRLDRVFAHDDPTGEVGAAWGVKERLRMLLACTDLDTADTARGLLARTEAANTASYRNHRHYQARILLRSHRQTRRRRTRLNQQATTANCGLSRKGGGA
jgi:hypothetical protein